MVTLVHLSILTCLGRDHLMDTCSIRLDICLQDRVLCKWVEVHRPGMVRKVHRAARECRCRRRTVTRRVCRQPRPDTCHLITP